MLKIWRGADSTERNGLILIFAMVAIAFIVGLMSEFGRVQGGGTPYSALRYGLWAVLLLVYLVRTTFHNVRAERVSAQYFVLELLLLALSVATISYLIPTGMSWLLITPLAGDMHPHFKFPRSLPLYTFLLLCTITPFYVDDWPNIDWENFLTGMASFGILIGFVAVFTGFQRREADGRAALAVANRQLAEYAGQVEELATTKERNRLAREIHDNLGHYLTVVNVQLEAGKLFLDRDVEKTRTAIEKAQRLTQEGLLAVRESVGALRESALNKPVDEAIGELVESARASGISAEYQILGTPYPLDPKLNLTLYRTAQEGLTNIRKHAQAANVSVVLGYDSAETISLNVKDNGAGSDDPSGGFGLVGIRERINLLGGKLEIKTAVGQGFEIAVELPTSAK